LAFGFWLLAFGFWLLAFGFWLLAFGANLNLEGRVTFLDDYHLKYCYVNAHVQTSPDRNGILFCRLRMQRQKRYSGERVQTCI
jgi:hypothetical protein